MENLCSSSSQPSGVRLLALLQGQWKEILRREESNVSLMHLYGTGTHWVAFERSACQLSRLCTEAKIVPMRLSGFPFPVVRPRSAKRNRNILSMIYRKWRRGSTDFHSKCRY